MFSLWNKNLINKSGILLLFVSASLLTSCSCMQSMLSLEKETIGRAYRLRQVTLAEDMISCRDLGFISSFGLGIQETKDNLARIAAQANATHLQLVDLYPEAIHLLTTSQEEEFQARGHIWQCEAKK